MVPGHCDNPEHDKADVLAKDAAGSDENHPFYRPVTREKAAIRKQIRTEREDT
jgi:hypothetical protein